MEHKKIKKAGNQKWFPAFSLIYYNLSKQDVITLVLPLQVYILKIIILQYNGNRSYTLLCFIILQFT